MSFFLANTLLVCFLFTSNYFVFFFYSLRCNLVLCQFSSDVHFPYFLCLNWIIKGLCGLCWIFFIWFRSKCGSFHCNLIIIAELQTHLMFTQLRLGTARWQLSYVIKSISLMLNWTYRYLCVHCAHMKLSHNRDTSKVNLQSITRIEVIRQNKFNLNWFSICTSAKPTDLIWNISKYRDI